jgi:hypothetical protein
MSTYKLTIKEPNARVLALLNLIRVTEDVVLEEDIDTYHLTDAQKSILDQRKANHLAGTSKSFSWNEVKERAKASK